VVAGYTMGRFNDEKNIVQDLGWYDGIETGDEIYRSDCIAEKKACVGIIDGVHGLFAAFIVDGDKGRFLSFAAICSNFAVRDGCQTLLPRTRTQVSRNRLPA
jgi:hypothetical protein